MNNEFEISSELRAQINKLPVSTGIYIYRNSNNEVIYVGKALNIKKRVSSYFKGNDDRYQIKFLIRQIASIENIITESEEQAFILERDLINKYKPKFNIRLKDDKNYLSIRVDLDNPWPKLELVRKITDDGARYFGPYVSGLELRSVLEVINRAIPLRTCTDTVLFNRQRPCLEYQIKRCVAPCCLPVDRAQYLKLLEQAISVLKGQTSELIKKLNDEMEKASDDLEYERAAEIRDRIDALKNFNTGQNYTSEGTNNWDIFYIQRDQSLVSVATLFFRNGRISNGRNYALENVQVDDDELINAVLGQFYSANSEFPEEIIINHDLADQQILQAHLKSLCGRKVPLSNPQKGLKYRLLNLAKLNAEQEFKSRFLSYENQQELFAEMARLFRLRQIPRRIECVDISNLQGSNIVGAVVSYFDGVPDKSRYRKYKVRLQTEGPNDFASMKEVVFRHLKSVNFGSEAPDLLIIDGGAIQLDYAIQAVDELKLNIDIIALAKERRKDSGELKSERVFLPGESESIDLSQAPKLMNFVAGIRDEAHRFVITFHRSKRSERVISSRLDEFKGISPQKKRALLRDFKSIENIASMSAEELAHKSGLSKEISEELIVYLRN